jgi:hypothetical protein
MDIVIGLTLIALGVFALVFACKAKFETEISALLGCLCGFLIAIGMNCLLQPFKLQRDEYIKVKANQIPNIKKEIFINSNGNTDTTYYYMFKNASIIRDNPE